MSELLFKITGNCDSLRNALDQSKKAFHDTAKAAEDAGADIDQVFSKIKKDAAGIVAAFSAKEFINNMVKVRGQFQQLEVAFTTMLGSAEKANTLMNQLTKTAAVTPFDLQGVANGAKQLLAYGIKAEEVNETLIRLGDIAAGLSLPLGDLVYLYGTTITQGRMYTQDLRQFMGRGIPLAEELAKQFGVAESKVGELVTAGKVGAEEFKKAILSMSGEGGKFSGLMEAQSKTITGQISNIEDAVDMMFNELGEQSEGFINTALGGVSTLIENYKTVGKIILTVATAYGTYKAALIAVLAIQRAMNVAGSVSAFLSLAKSVTSAKDAMALFNLAVKANPLGLILSAVTTAAVAFGLFSGGAEEATEEVNRFGESAVKQMHNIDTLFAVVNNTSKDSKVHKDAVDELCKIYEEYGYKIDAEADKLRQLVNLHEMVTAAIQKEGEERQKANLLASYEEAMNQHTEDMKSELKHIYETTEWDESSALALDDFDADEYQEKAKELATIVGAIIESESQNLSKLTGDELEEHIRQVSERIKQVYQDQGLRLKDNSGHYVEALEDVPDLMRKYAESLHATAQGRDRLIESMHKEEDATKSMVEDAMKAEDLQSKSISELYKATEEAKKNYSDLGSLTAKPIVDTSSVTNLVETSRGAIEKMSELDDSKAKPSTDTSNIENAAAKAEEATGKVEDLDNSEATPLVNTDSIDAGTDAANDLQNGVDQLNGRMATPIINTSYIDNAIIKTNTLLGQIWQLQKGSGGEQQGQEPRLGFTTPFKIGLNAPGVQKPKVSVPQFTQINGQYVPINGSYIPVTDPDLLRQAELNRRFNAIGNRSNKDALLKDIKDALETAPYGSDMEKELLDLQKRIKDKYDEKKKTSKTKKDKKSGKDNSDKIQDEMERLEDMQFELEFNRIREAYDLETQVTNARLDAMEDGYEKVRLLQQQQNKEEIDAIVRQKEDAIKKYIDEEERLFDQQEKIKKAQNEKYKEQKFDRKSVDTSSIAAQYDEIIRLTRLRQQLVTDKDIQESLRAFLEEHGTVEQQRTAIKKRYETEIAKAKSPYEAASLTMQRDSQLKELESKAAEERIDWGGVFSSLEGHTKAYLESLRDQLQGILNEGSLPLDQLSVVQEKLREVNAAISKQGNMLSFVSEATREHNRLLQEEKDAQDALNAAKQEESDIFNETERARQSITDYANSIGADATLPIEEMLGQFEEGSDQYKQMSDLIQKVIVGEARLEEARKKTATATAKAKNAEDGAERKGAQKIADLFGGVAEYANKYLSDLPDLMGKLGLDSAGEKTKMGLDAINDAAGAAADFASGNYVGAALKAFNALDNIGNIIGVGGLSDPKLEQDIEKLTQSNENLQRAIDALSEQMSDASVLDVKEIYEQQQTMLEQTASQTREMMQRSGAAHDTGFWGTGIGGQHSSNKKIDEAMSASDWANVSQAAGRTIRKASDFWSLSSKEMYQVMRDANAQWTVIMEKANDGTADAAKFMNDYIELWKRQEELENAYKERWTNVSFDSVKDSFLSALSDMERSASDFSKDFTQYLFNAVMNAQVGELLNEELKQWYDNFSDYMEQGQGEISEANMNALKADWDRIVQEGITMRDKIATATGYDTFSSSEGTATYSVAKNFTQEQGDVLNGRLTSIHIAVRENNAIGRQVASILTNVASAGGSLSTMSDSVSEIRNMMIYTNSYLEDVVRYAKLTYKDFGEKIDTIKYTLDSKL